MEDINKIISTLKRLLYTNEEFSTFDILNNSTPTLVWEASNLGMNFYTLTLNIDLDFYSHILSMDFDSFYEKYGTDNLRDIEDHISGYLSDILRGEPDQINGVIIKPKIKNYINWEELSDIYDKESLINDIEKARNILIAVSNGKNIRDYNDEYISVYQNIDIALQKIGVQNPNPYKTLWEAYQYWSAHLSSYADRRVYFQNLYEGLLKDLNESEEYTDLSLHLEYTGWKEIDRKIAEIKKQFKEAENEEQFNAIGAICRSTYVSLATNVFDENIHKTVDGVKPSETDYKRKLEAFINYNLSGQTNESFRSHCKKTLNLADELVHKTTANKTQTALTITSLISIVNIVKILNGNEIKI